MESEMQTYTMPEQRGSAENGTAETAPRVVTPEAVTAPDDARDVERMNETVDNKTPVADPEAQRVIANAEAVSPWKIAHDAEADRATAVRLEELRAAIQATATSYGADAARALGEQERNRHDFTLVA
jgi:hypothetical protein